MNLALPSPPFHRALPRRASSALPDFFSLPPLPMPKKPASPSDAPPYEEAFARLESLIESLETGDVPLAELVAKFEEGHKLLKICQQHLHAAELRVEQLKLSDSPDPAFSSFDEERQP
jgi:exodeoxyribonuclease VII small subunit